MQYFIIVLIIKLLFLYTDLQAQSFDGGFKAGLVASEVSGDQLSGPHKLGFYAGVFTNREITNFSKLQLELKYISKGSRGVPSETQPRDYRFNLDYTEIALFFKHNLLRYSSQSYIQKMSVEIGLSMGVLVSAYEEEDGLELDFSNERPYNIIEGSIWGGLYFPVFDNMDIPFAKEVNLNFRFSNSVTPVRQHASGQVYWYNWGQYHTLWTFGIEFTI